MRTNKLKEWGRRYLPLEIVATVTALMGAYGANVLTSGEAVAVALAGTWGENCGYYSYAAWREMRAQKQSEGTTTATRFGQTLRNLLYEFGTAEVVDSFVSRPFFMYIGPAMLGHLGAGIVAGKLAADVVFYAIAILFYERGKKT